MKACYACGADLGNPERVGRQDRCRHCGAELRCCRNCRFYAPGRHSDCAEPHAEPVADKARGNFCEYFAFRDARPVIAGAEKAAVLGRLEELFRRKA